MGAHAFESRIPADAWPLAISRISDAGIRLEYAGERPGIVFWDCRRGRATMGLAVEESGKILTVTVYGSLLRHYRRPFSTGRLRRDLLEAIRRASGESTA